MGDTSVRVAIQVVGPFRISKPTGEDCTPRQRKTCALVALLALAPEYKRSRVWIQDKLWSTRDKEQGSASLRQSLVEIRKVLGSHRNCLIVDKYTLALDPRLVSIDIEDENSLLSKDSQGIELLEGLDIRDPEFEDWLCSQRQRFSAQLATVIGRHKDTPAAAEVGDVVPHNRLLLYRAAQAGQANALANSILDSIAKTLSELGVASILDCPSQDTNAPPPGEKYPGSTLCLRYEADSLDGSQTIRLALLRSPSRELAWSSTLQVPDEEPRSVKDLHLLRSINLAANVASDYFFRTRAGDYARALSSIICYSGILQLFRLGQKSFDEADRLFTRAFELDPRGIHLAWRAYLRTFLLAERKYSCRDTVAAEAIGFTRRALEMEPYNSYVAALSAHVQMITYRSYVAAFELAERSIHLNYANPIGWACLGMAKSYLGRPEEGFRHTLLARTIAGSAPYRFQLDALSCIAGTMAGDTDKAAYLAEASHALAPEFAPPLRYLSAIYMHKRLPERSLEMVQKLKCLEPDFSYEKLWDKAYPSAGLQQSSIIEALPRRQI